MRPHTGNTTERTSRQVESEWEKAAALAQAQTMASILRPDSSRSRMVTLKLRADRLSETKRNRIEDRKFEILARNLERQKKQVAARVSRDQQEVKRKYQALIKDHNENTRTFFLHPGFRYKRNGQVKVDSKYSELMSLLTKGHGLDTFRAASLEAAAIEAAALMHGRSPAEENDGKTQRAMLKDSRASARMEPAASLQRVLSPIPRENRKHHLDSDFEENYRRRTHAFCERFSRKCTRSSCMACEFDLKYKTEEDTESPPPPPHEWAKKKNAWRPVPSGVYVQNPDTMKSRRSLSGRSRAHSPSSSHVYIDEMHRAQMQSEAEVTTSAMTHAAAATHASRAAKREKLQISRSLPETETKPHAKSILKSGETKGKEEGKSGEKTVEEKPSDDRGKASGSPASMTSAKKGESKTKAGRTLSRLKEYVTQKVSWSSLRILDSFRVFTTSHEGTLIPFHRRLCQSPLHTYVLYLSHGLTEIHVRTGLHYTFRLIRKW